MRINHNIMAMNAHRQLGSNSIAQGKSIEKLSSGFRINRAGDDAAGLAISEKMRAQIRGLNQATRNAQDGISLVQTAEGALTETHSILQRMRELAIQSANGTFDDDVDRANLQAEVATLKEEVNRIAKSSNFNGIKLLDGSLGDGRDLGNTGAGEKKLVQVQSNLKDFEQKMTDAVAARHHFATGTLNKGGSAAVDIMQVDFIDENGETRSFVLAENGLNLLATAKETLLVDAIYDKAAGDATDPKRIFDTSFVSVTDNQEDADKMRESYEKFLELYDVKLGMSSLTKGPAATGAGIDIIAKNAGTKHGKLIGVKVTSVATLANVLTKTTELGKTAYATEANASTIGIKSTDKIWSTSVVAQDAKYTINLKGSDSSNVATVDIKAQTTVKIMGKTYEFQKLSNAMTVAKGNEWVKMGANDAESVKNLVAKLRLDGYDVSVDANEDEAIVFNNLDQVMIEAAKTPVKTNNADNIEITSQDEQVSKFSVAFQKGTNSASEVITVSYLDENGDKKSFQVGYKEATTAVAGTPIQAVKDYIEKDSVLKELFDTAETVTDSAADGGAKLVLNSKISGANAPRILDIKSSNVKSGQALDGVEAEIQVPLDKHESVKFNGNLHNGETLTVGGKVYEFAEEGVDVEPGHKAITIGANRYETLKNLTDQMEKDGFDVHADLAKGIIDISGLNYGNEEDDNAGNIGLTLQVGDSSEDFQKLTVKVQRMDVQGLAIQDVDVSDQVKADASTKMIKDAINAVSSTRGSLGALQNRLEHTINNLNATAENITASESRIRDVDMAKEMMNYTKQNILNQAAQAMLAQANQLPQGVLQLLR